MEALFKKEKRGANDCRAKGKDNPDVTEKKWTLIPVRQKEQRVVLGL